MQQDLVALAFAAGMVAALNPCGFAMLPAYLALVVHGDGARANIPAAAAGRAVAAATAMTLGFVAVFGLFGLLTVSLASTVQRYLPYATIAIGGALVALGSWLLTGRELALTPPKALSHKVFRAPTRGVGSMFCYGVGYAIASLSCTVGPFLAVTGAGIAGGPVERILVYAAYAAGFALVVGASAVAVALAGAAAIARMRLILPYVNRIGGAVLILVGLYVGYYGYYEVRLFTGVGNPTDPIVAAAGRLQGSIAGWVHQHGAWPWVALLAAVTLATVTWACRRRQCRADRATAGGESWPRSRRSPR